MEGHMHSMSDLFAQLGLSSSPDAIQRFIALHRPIPAYLALHEASFWSRAQAEFLGRNVQEDADWAIVTDSLNIALRENE